MPIKLKYLIYERMTFSQLMSISDPKRIERSNDVSVKPLIVRAINDKEAWKFSYKSNPSTTGLRHQGFIYFFKENVDQGDNVLDLECITDCSCPDYKFRWAYNNSKEDAGVIGPGSLNKCINRPPINSLGNGLCKHLLSLKEYLSTQVESKPTNPNQPGPAEKPVIKPKTTAEKKPKKDETVPEEDPTIAPNPDQDEELPQDTSNKTETPQGPDIETPEEDELDNNNKNKNKKPKLKENVVDTSRVKTVLDSLCKQGVFIIK